jgi:citronellol/citronellal dehydrogenase|tara:strand:- start:1863 stop:2690 length:828 start_codon:yes stop_codon:yes gene_type:complete
VTDNFSGYTFLITGASRGIGKAIAVRLGEEGANVAVCARSMDENHKLPGTLPETVEAVEAVGGNALAIQLDVRDDEQVNVAIEKCVSHFGGLDGVICNAGALYIAPFSFTPMKRFDLVHQVNVRATYATIQAALPHLHKSDRGRVLVICPPVSMNPKWLAGTTAYTISKYGMSVLVGGLAAELVGDEIGVNGLWPATTIDTAAVRYNEALGGEEMANRSRKPSIVADAALHILSQSSDCTGRFFIDEEALAEAGITDLEQYSVTPGGPLQPDFYV